MCAIGNGKAATSTSEKETRLHATSSLQVKFIVMNDSIVENNDLILITGAGGFIGSRVVEQFLEMGFSNLRCLVRSAKSCAKLQALVQRFHDNGNVEILHGTLLSPADCLQATKNAAVIVHLAAGRGEKSYPDAYLNSVVATRNLIEAAIRHSALRRLVNVSSFSVYSNAAKRWNGLLDEHCPIETHPEQRGDAYAFAKVKQEELVTDYEKRWGVRTVTIRPGHVYGPGNENISGRVGVDTFGFFIHLGGTNRIPLTYVDNCAYAIALASVKRGVDGEILNIVDDDLPSSRSFLRQYKRHVYRFTSIYLPHVVSYALCWIWEEYSRQSAGQLPPVFNRRRWRAFWKKTRYSNLRLKERLGWSQTVSTAEGLRRYFEACRDKRLNA